MKSRKLSEDFPKPLITILTNVKPHTGGARDAGMKRFETKGMKLNLRGLRLSPSDAPVWTRLMERT